MSTIAESLHTDQLLATAISLFGIFYSSFYPGAKRLITDEHMAAGMNSLYITNDHNYSGNAAMFNPDNDLNMQFSPVSDQMQNNDDQGER